MRGIKRFLQAINLCSSKILGFDPTAEPAGGRGPPSTFFVFRRIFASKDEFKHLQRFVSVEF